MAALLEFHLLATPARALPLAAMAPPRIHRGLPLHSLFPQPQVMWGGPSPISLPLAGGLTMAAKRRAIRSLIPVLWPLQISPCFHGPLSIPPILPPPTMEAECPLPPKYR